MGTVFVPHPSVISEMWLQCLLSLGSAAASFPPVVSWSGCSLDYLRLLLHRERGLGCALQLSLEMQPLGCCFVGWVLRLRLLVASVAGSLAGGRDGAFLTLDLVVRCSSTSGAEIEFWRPGTLCWSPVPSTLRRLENLSSSSDFRGYGSGFLSPTAGRSFIGGTSACSGSLLRLTAVSPALRLAFAVFCSGGGFPCGY